MSGIRKSGRHSAPAGLYEPLEASRQLGSWTGAVRSSWPDAPRCPSWWFMGAHGGAGATTLALCSQGGSEVYGGDAERLWPQPSIETARGVVVVTRTTAWGMEAAQDATRQFHTGRVPEGTDLLGLVFVADAPGRLPKPLALLRRLVASAYPQTWSVDWHETCRVTGRGEDLVVPALESVMKSIRSTLRSTTP